MTSHREDVTGGDYTAFWPLPLLLNTGSLLLVLPGRLSLLCNPSPRSSMSGRALSWAARQRLRLIRTHLTPQASPVGLCSASPADRLFRGSDSRCQTLSFHPFMSPNLPFARLDILLLTSERGRGTEQQGRRLLHTSLAWGSGLNTGLLGPTPATFQGRDDAQPTALHQPGLLCTFLLILTQGYFPIYSQRE